MDVSLSPPESIDGMVMPQFTRNTGAYTKLSNLVDQNARGHLRYQDYSRAMTLTAVKPCWLS